MEKRPTFKDLQTRRQNEEKNQDEVKTAGYFTQKTVKDNSATNDGVGKSILTILLESALVKDVADSLDESTFEQLTDTPPTVYVITGPLTSKPGEDNGCIVPSNDSLLFKFGKLAPSLMNTARSVKVQTNRARGLFDINADQAARELKKLTAKLTRKTVLSASKMGGDLPCIIIAALLLDDASIKEVSSYLNQTRVDSEKIWLEKCRALKATKKPKKDDSDAEVEAKALDDDQSFIRTWTASDQYQCLIGDFDVNSKAKYTGIADIAKDFFKRTVFKNVPEDLKDSLAGLIISTVV